MSRAQYSDDLEKWDLIRWRGQVMSAIRGKRGQKCLRDLVAALEALPDKRLIAEELRNEEGEHCALGALGAARGVDLDKVDPEDPEQVAKAFDIAEQLAREIAYENDESGYRTPEERYEGMMRWARSHILNSGSE